MTAAAAALVLLGFASATMATESGGSTYPIGVATVLPGFTIVEPGLNLLNYNTYYSAGRLNNGAGAKALPAFHASVAATIYRIDYSPAWTVFGGRYAMQAIIPFADVSVDRLVGTKRQSGSKSSIGDTIFVPFALGWSGTSDWGRWATGVKLHIVTPTGAYRSTDVANVGRNYTSQIASYGIGLITPDGWNAGVQANYIHNQINPATSYLSGDEFEADYSIGHKLDKNITLQLNGYVYRQVMKDRQFGAIVGTGNEGQTIGFGPQVLVSLPYDIALAAKWQHEVAVRNRPQGDRFWLQFFVPFGDGKPSSFVNAVLGRPTEMVSR